MIRITDYINKVIQGDNRIVMSQMPAGSVDLIITSPPYNAGQEYESWSSDAEYEEFIDSVVAGCARILKPTGRLVWNIANSITKGKKIHNVMFTHMKALEKYLIYRDYIIWDQLNSECDTAWGSWESASAPYFRHKTESILIYYKDQWNKGKGVSNIPKGKFQTWTMDVWTMSTAKRNTGHPCPFPIELAQRAIYMFSFVGDIVCDPMCGQGTTLKAAKQLGRRYIGIDTSEKYCSISRDQVSQEELPL